jgi:cytochrome b561
VAVQRAQPGVILAPSPCGAHHWLALLLFATFLLHLAAALFHGLVRHDGVLASMAPWRRRDRH